MIYKWSIIGWEQFILRLFYHMHQNTLVSKLTEFFVLARSSLCSCCITNQYNNLSLWLSEDFPTLCTYVILGAVSSAILKNNFPVTFSFLKFV